MLLQMKSSLVGLSLGRGCTQRGSSQERRLCSLQSEDFIETDTRLCVLSMVFHLLCFSPPLDYPCSGMLGMVSGLISDSQITASNQGDRNWMPENIRLVTSRSGWALPPSPHPYINEWLQVDLGDEKIVRGVIIQGGKHRENKVFMKKFKIAYSNNGSDWKTIMDDSKRKAKVRPGGGDQTLSGDTACPL